MTGFINLALRKLHSTIQDGKIVMVAINMALSEVSLKLKGYLDQKPRAIYLACLGTLFLDGNFSSSGTDLIIHANRWKVQREMVIDLSGKRATEHRFKKA